VDNYILQPVLLQLVAALLLHSSQLALQPAELISFRRQPSMSN